METVIQLNSGAKLSPHFTLGEMTTSNHKDVYNIPSHEAIANLKRVCTWLEVLRKRYNALYVQGQFCRIYNSAEHNMGIYNPHSITNADITSSRISNSTEQRFYHTTPQFCRISNSTEQRSLPIIINSGYRSPQLNKKIGGAPSSNHLTGCACDIRVKDMEQALRYATILLDYSDESKQEFDELLIERNRYGAMWLHFAVRPKDNRRKILFINA